MQEFIVRTESRRMATKFSFEVFCNGHDAHRVEVIQNEAHAHVDFLEGILSEFLPDSEVSRINRGGMRETFSISDPLFRILKISERVAHETGHAFDPSFRSREGTCFKDRFHLDPQTRQLRKNYNGAQLSFGAIGKGFALDEVRQILELAGFSDYRLNAGGSSLILSGSPGHGRTWSLSWAWDRDEEGCLLGRKLAHHTSGVQCIGVSGSLEKGEHIHRSVTSRQGIRSAWVSATHAAEADAYSTALYSLGWTIGVQRIEDSWRRIGLAAIDHARVPYWNREFEKSFGRLTPEFSSLK